MQEKYEKQNHAEMSATHIRTARQILQGAAESFLANLPILVLGIVVTLAVASEFFI